MLETTGKRNLNEKIHSFSVWFREHNELTEKKKDAKNDRKEEP